MKDYSCWNTWILLGILILLIIILIIYACHHSGLNNKLDDMTNQNQKNYSVLVNEVQSMNTKFDKLLEQNQPRETSSEKEYYSESLNKSFNCLNDMKESKSKDKHDYCYDNNSSDHLDPHSMDSSNKNDKKMSSSLLTESHDVDCSKYHHTRSYSNDDVKK